MTACSCLKINSDCVHVVEQGCAFVVLIPTGPQSCTIYPSLAFYASSDSLVDSYFACKSALYWTVPPDPLHRYVCKPGGFD
jgi:hypothetical protein